MPQPAAVSLKRLRRIANSCRKGCETITLTGFKTENSLRKLGTVNFHINADSYGLMEVAHSALARYISGVAMATSREMAVRKAESL